MVSSSNVQPQSETGLRVFLSHSAKDREFVERFAGALTGAGFTPWLCEGGVEGGASFVSRIHQGLAKCDAALLVWSPGAARSVWTEQEGSSVLARQVEEHKVRLGIVLWREQPLPPLLRTSNFIDARHDEATALRDAVEWLRQRQAAQRHSGVRAPVYLPDYRPQDFVGRTAYLDRLRTTFSHEPSAVLLYGLPGAGKSTLALRFAWETQKDFDAVIFQLCGLRSLDGITAELTNRLPIDVRTRPPEQQRAAAKQWLRGRRSLLILDDVSSPDLRELEPGPPCSVLYITRTHSLPWITPAEALQVDRFTDAEAEELFHTYLDDNFTESEVTRQREALLRFARQVELLPIAVSVGANILRQRSTSALNRAGLRIQLRELSDSARDVNALFRRAIESRAAAEQQLLTAGAICAPEGFALPLAAEIAGLDDYEAEDAANELVHSSLLRVQRIVDEAGERLRFSLHAFLREALLGRITIEETARLQERHSAAMDKLSKPEPS